MGFLWINYHDLTPPLLCPLYPFIRARLVQAEATFYLSSPRNSQRRV